MLEVCETESSPAGWRCNWSRKEKQYYYIHEITEEISWTYPEEDVEAVKKLAAQKHKRDKKAAKSAAAGTLAQLTKAIDVITVDGDLKSLFFEKIVEKCTHNEEKDGEVKEKVEKKVELNIMEDGELSPAKHSDAESRRGERDARDRIDIFGSKQKSGSSKEKYIPKAYRARSTSKEPDKPKAFDDYSKTHEKSKPKSYNDHHSSRDRSKSKERTKPRAFDDRHDILRVRSKSTDKTKPRAFDEISNESSRNERSSSTKSSSKRRHSESDESSRDNDKKSKHKRKHDSADKKHKKHSKHKKSKSSKSSKHKKHRSRSNSSADSRSHEDATIDLTGSPDTETKTQTGASETAGEKPTADVGIKQEHTTQDFKDSGDKMDSENEMDISPLPSPTPQLETAVSPQPPQNDQPAKPNEPDSVNNVQPAAVTQSDSIDNLLQSMEKEMQETNKTAPVYEPQPKKPVSLVRPPPPKLPAPPTTRPVEEETQGLVAAAAPVNTAAPPPPPPPQPATEELSALDEFYKEVESELAEKHSTVSAPVLYTSTEAPSDAASKPPSHISLANAPVLYTAPATQGSSAAVPGAFAADVTGVASTQAVTAERSKSPIRFPESSAATSAALKQSKDKQHKTHKKSSKKASKMPAALVQKWQKVQSEITTDIMNEKRLKDELLK